MRILFCLFCGLTASAAVLSASGCGGSIDGGSTARFEQEQLSQFEAQAVHRFCARIDACCSDLSYPFDEAGCEALNGNNIVQFFNLHGSDGLFCSEASTCVPLGVAGDRCMGSPECGAGTYCSLDAERCESLLKAGDVCEDDWQCETNDCSGTCTARPRVSPEFCLGHIPPPPSP